MSTRPSGSEENAAQLLQSALAVFAAVGWQVHLVTNPSEAVELIAGLTQPKDAIALHSESLPAAIELAQDLGRRGLEVTVFGKAKNAAEESASPGAVQARSRLSSAGVGVTGATALVAETGTLLLAEDDGYGRLVSNLPPVHVALAHRSQLVATLDEGLAAVRGSVPQGAGFPRYLSGISGPSKTGDIEMEIVRGMHGPGEVHLIILP